MFDKAASDLRLPADHSRTVLLESPGRWDEYLDLDIPVLIAHTCGDWGEVGKGLQQSGLSSERVIRLVESNGAVKQVCVDSGTLEPVPESDDWTLALNWTHPDEGWRSRLPLWGRTFIVTRQSEQAKGMMGQLEDLGAQVQLVPTIEFVEPDDPGIVADAIERLSEFDWLVFTSPNGVRYFFQHLDQSEHDHRALHSAQFACIGRSTSRALKSEGFGCDLMPDKFVAEGLLVALEAEDLTGKQVLIPRAQVAREVLPETLAQWGAQVVVAPVYKTVHPPLEDGTREWAQGSTRVLFTSASTVKNWVKVTGNRDLPCFCIGPVTAGAAEHEGLQILGVAEVHTLDGLVQEVLRESD
jgi:uroporphyrinogen-III synthase